MSVVQSLRGLIAFRHLQTDHNYQRISAWSRGAESNFGSPEPAYRYQAPPVQRTERLRSGSLGLAMKLLGFAMAVLVTLPLFASRASQVRPQSIERHISYHWQAFNKLVSHYNGVRILVPYGKYEPENRYNKSTSPLGLTADEMSRLSPMPPLDPVPYNPYPDYRSHEYLKAHHEISGCCLDAEETVLPPEIYMYPGLPQHLAQPFYGS